jgi:tRNA-modifying protein YgfZ
MLHGLLTNDLLGAPPGKGVYAAMLTPKGRTIAELRALALSRAGGTEVLIDLPREALAGTVEHLKKFVPPMFARWEVAEQIGCIGVYGPRAAELIQRTWAELPELAEDAFVELELAGTPVVAVATRYAGGEPGYDLFAQAASLPGLWETLVAAGARPVGHAALETLRIEGGRPRYGHDLTEETIPTEAYESTGLMERAISFGKGCYTGQEVIVRIAHRGHVNRHLRGLRLGDAPTPANGTPLFLADGSKQTGRVTSAAFSPLLGETIALGYVRREVEPGARVRIGAADGAEALVTVLPFEREG